MIYIFISLLTWTFFFFVQLTYGFPREEERYYEIKLNTKHFCITVENEPYKKQVWSNFRKGGGGLGTR